ncbi:predicted protein [Nematostella vectensis]|uniref:TauD/TfdA-like domain-containing protein n=1 Tax=Nematostella vectensis TaxID=45351 RepID=A7RKT5_NEMVE|nr:predicted protein [Nematostella vectensis]|eukprot:XP_001640023.1 predicted protein [Nematostella vectensis]
MALRSLSKHIWRSNSYNKWSACGIAQQLLYSTEPDPLTKETLFFKLPVKEILPTSNDPIAGRKWLPGSHGRGFPKYLAKPRKDFPHALMAKSADMYSIDEIAKVTRQVIDEDLPKCGAVLFRGLNLYEVQDFAHFSLALGFRSMEYTGGLANREAVDSEANVYSANDDPSVYTIEPHNEMAYSPVYPRKLIFFCAEEPAEGCGGYTVLCKSSDFLPNIHPDVINKLGEKQIRYINRVPDKVRSSYISWQQVFHTTDKKYGDGSKIEPEVLEHIRGCIWNSTVGFQWRQGDMLLVDNLTTLHGRLGFNGKRKILATLLEN